MPDKSFWKRPEGITGGLIMAAIVIGGLVLFNRILPALIVLVSNTLYLAALLVALGVAVFVALDPKARNLFWYGYKSVMRWITGLFVKIDPISVLKTYIEDLEDNLRKLSKQIGALRGQMRQLKGIMDGNAGEIEKNMATARQAQQQQDEKNLTLSARKAGRLQEANEKYNVLYQKMEVLYRLLTRMYENSEIVLEDLRDQVKVKEQEYHAIRTSHGAIRSAMSVLQGDPDKRALFDQALENMTDEVSQRIGEMERFMTTSRNLMDSIDLQNGVFEEEGLRMLEEMTPLPPPPVSKPLDINAPRKEPLKDEGNSNDYSRFFE